jgi:hypothetical protein
MGYRMVSVTHCFCLAEGPGFEPGLTGPEPVVLPLDDPSKSNKVDSYIKKRAMGVKLKERIQTLLLQKPRMPQIQGVQTLSCFLCNCRVNAEPHLLLFFLAHNKLNGFL